MHASADNGQNCRCIYVGSNTKSLQMPGVIADQVCCTIATADLNWG